MEKKEFVVIDKKILLKLIARSHKWCAVYGYGAIDDLDMDELDALFLQYVKDTGIAVPEDISGYEAIKILSEWDLDFYEVRV
jgi:hypothetical protein